MLPWLFSSNEAPSELKEGDIKDNPSNEEGEPIVPGKAPFQIEEEGAGNLDELQEVNPGMNKDPQYSFNNGNIFLKKRALHRILQTELRCTRMDILKRARP